MGTCSYTVAAGSWWQTHEQTHSRPWFGSGTLHGRRGNSCLLSSAVFGSWNRFRVEGSIIFSTGSQHWMPAHAVSLQSKYHSFPCSPQVSFNHWKEHRGADRNSFFSCTVFLIWIGPCCTFIDELPPEAQPYSELIVCHDVSVHSFAILIQTLRLINEIIRDKRNMQPFKVFSQKIFLAQCMH